jgi:hypothetical protein
MSSSLTCLFLSANGPSKRKSTSENPHQLECLRICREAKSSGRRSLVYSIYSGTRDIQSRLNELLEQSGFKAAVLKASVAGIKRED